MHYLGSIYMWQSHDVHPQKIISALQLFSNPEIKAEKIAKNKIFTDFVYWKCIRKWVPNIITLNYGIFLKPIFKNVPW